MPPPVVEESGLDMEEKLQEAMLISFVSVDEQRALLARTMEQLRLCDPLHAEHMADVVAHLEACSSTETSITETNNAAGDTVLCHFGEEEIDFISSLSATDMKAKLGFKNVPETHTHLAILIHNNRVSEPQNRNVRVLDPLDVVNSTYVWTANGWEHRDPSHVGMQILRENKKRLIKMLQLRPGFRALSDFMKKIGRQRYEGRGAERDFHPFAKNIVRAIT